MVEAADTPDAGATRCGIDTVEIARIERLLSSSPADAPPRLFTAQELEDSGTGAGRIASLAARFAAKEACAQLFPREMALRQIEPEGFSVARGKPCARLPRRRARPAGEIGKAHVWTPGT